MREYLHKIRKHLFSARRYFHSQAGVTTESLEGQASSWVISRGLSTFHAIDLSHLEPAKRGAALQNQVELQSPFENPDYSVYWQAGVAEVWTWNRDTIAAACRENLAAADVAELIDFIPEGAFSPRRSDGFQRYDSMDGCVVQYWLAGTLRAERFWPDPPEDTELNLFCVAVGGGQHQGDLQEVALQTEPWPAEGAMVRRIQNYEPLLVTATCLLFAFLLAFQSASWLGLQFMTMGLDSRTSALREAVAPAVELRTRTLEARARNQTLLSLEGESQLGMMTTLSNDLPAVDGDSGRFKRWHFEADSLAILIHRPQANLEAYAAALDNIEFLGEVALTPNDRAAHLEIDARLTP